MGHPAVVTGVAKTKMGQECLRENYPLQLESRRACPELAERGRLKITQDVVLGILTRSPKSRETPGLADPTRGSCNIITSNPCRFVPPNAFQAGTRFERGCVPTAKLVEEEIPPWRK